MVLMFEKMFVCKKLILKQVGAKESSTGLAIPAAWDLVADKQMMQEEQPL